MMVRAVALATLSLLACHGCNDGRPPAASAPSASTSSPADPSTTNAPPILSSSGETVIRAEDDGKSFDTAKGSTVTFKLASNAGTGYVWIPMHVDSTILAQQGDRTSEIASDTPGAPKFDVYRFTAGSAGTTAVDMSLKRSFGSAPPARAIHVTVSVH